MSTSGQLRKSAIGTSGIVFFVVAAAAPLGATLGAGPVVFASNGVGAPGMYLVASVVLLLFAVGYATMSRHVTSAGGFTAYISLGLGSRAGHASAGIALLAYNCLLLGLLGQFGVFARDLLSRWGWDADWQVPAVIALALTGALGYLEITLSAKVLGVLMIAEVLILVVFDLVIVGRGIDTTAFDPANTFSGAPGIALLFAFTCFVGFEATTIYGEEARDPRRTVARATYVAVVLIGIFYTVTTWAIGQAYGPDVVMARAAADPVTFVTGINTAVVGQFSTDLMQILVVTSVFAVMLAVHNTLTRYMFSLGRGGLLPAQLGRTHHRFQSPHRASVVQSVLTLVALSAFVIAGVDPFKQLFAWLMGLGTLGILVLQAAASLAVIAFFRHRAGSSLWRTLVAPLLGALGLAAGIVLAVVNFGVLTGITGPASALLPLLIPIVAFVAAVVAALRRHTVRLTASTTGTTTGERH
ncbi:amino acid transporter [Kibdelosporangium banguiense]|uniref:Amino acid transporter n=1 Tax=Kibdelosporangium banguiense TaxID=1365924 RepID=A0ABS4U1Q8_9PSEU|nr:APC family permease [Kibdelosporangium banguiense]MBP2330582.1 amino acid transporter [Kibdelosporangium banguiense]